MLFGLGNFILFLVVFHTFLLMNFYLHDFLMLEIFISVLLIMSISIMIFFSFDSSLYFYIILLSVVGGFMVLMSFTIMSSYFDYSVFAITSLGDIFLVVLVFSVLSFLILKLISNNYMEMVKFSFDQLNKSCNWVMLPFMTLVLVLLIVLILMLLIIDEIVVGDKGSSLFH